MRAMREKQIRGFQRQLRCALSDHIVDAWPGDYEAKMVLYEIRKAKRVITGEVPIGLIGTSDSVMAHVRSILSYLPV